MRRSKGVGNQAVLWEAIAPVVRWPLYSPRRFGLSVAALVLGLLLWASVAGDGSPTAEQPGLPSSSSSTFASSSTSTASGTSPSTSSSTASSSSTSTQDVAADGDLDDEGWVPVSSAPPAPVDPASAKTDAAIVKQATAAAAAFARTPATITASAWWARVKPHLTTQAQQDYAGVDPRNIPFTKVTTGSMLAPGEGDQHLVRVVGVVTDKGTVTVTMAREGDGWKVSSLAYPAGMH